MTRAEIATPWTGTGTQDDPNRPQLADDYPLNGWSDVTGQSAENLQPDPNLFVVMVECEDSVLTQIEADPHYAVLWSEEVADETI
jgi:hypothetical protein